MHINYSSSVGSYLPSCDKRPVDDSLRSVLLSIWHNRWFRVSTIRISGDNLNGSNDNDTLSCKYINQTKSVCSDLLALRSQIDSAQTARTRVRECVFSECKSNWVIQNAFMAVQSSSGLKGASVLQLNVRDSNVAFVENEGGGSIAFLRLDDLVEDAVNAGCWHVCRASAAISQSVDKIRLVFLLWGVSFCDLTMVWNLPESRRGGMGYEEIQDR